MTRARKILTGARTMASRNLVLLILLVVACCFGLANAQSAPTQKDVANADAQNPSQMLHAVDQLVEQNRQLEKQNHELMDQIDSLRQVLAKQAGATDATQKVAVATTGSTTASDSQQSQESRTASQTFSSEGEPYKWGGYTPNLGYKVA